MCECVSIRRFHFGWSEPVCTRAAHPLLWIRTFPLWIGASHQGTVVLVRSLPAHKGWPTTCLILATTYSGLVHGGTGADRWAQNGSSHSRAFWRFPNVDFFISQDQELSAELLRVCFWSLSLSIRPMIIIINAFLQHQVPFDTRVRLRVLYIKHRNNA